MDYDSVILRDERAAFTNDKSAIIRIVSYERRLRAAIIKYIKNGMEPLDAIDLEDALNYEEGYDPDHGE